MKLLAKARKRMRVPVKIRTPPSWLGVFEDFGDVAVLKAEIVGSAVVKRQRVQERVWIVRSDPCSGRVGLGKKCAAYRDIGAWLEELFGTQVKESCVFRVDLEETDRDGDSMTEQPAHPLSGFLSGARLPGELDLAVGESDRLRDLCGPVDAYRVGVKRGFGCCDGQHGAGGCPWRAALNESDDPALRVAEVVILGDGRGALCLHGGHGQAEENR